MSPTVTGKPAPRRHDHLAPADPLDMEVRDVMSPGVITISEDAALHHVQRALALHGVHALLVVGRSNSMPLGWVTARGLLTWAARDTGMACARDAITHPPATIEPSETLRAAITALAQPGVSRLLVAHRPGVAPEGVLSDLDVVAVSAH